MPTLYSLTGDNMRMAFNTSITAPNPEGASVDPQAGGSIGGKPIWDLTTIESNLNRSGYDWYTNNYGVLADGVLNYGFWENYDQLANSYYVNSDGSVAFTEAYNAEAFSPFSPAQIDAASNAIGLWNDLIAIDFQQTSADTGDINFGNTDTGGAQAYAYLPFGNVYDDFYADFGFEEIGRLSGDVWIDGFVPSNFFPLQDSFYSITTLVHEIGHSLGLSHPGDYDALDDNDGDGVPDPITYENDAAYVQDSLQYSIMSYFDAYETGAQYIDWTLLNFAYPATPQVHDVAAIQAIYGVDTTTRTGDTVYGFNSTADRSAFDFSLNTRPIVTIWDAGGNDTIDFSGWNTDSLIDLNQGAFSSGGGVVEFPTLEEVNAKRVALGFAPRSEATAQFYEDLKAELGLTSGLFTDNVAIAYGAVIENAIGGGGNDLLIANNVANKFTGNAGSDTVSYEVGTAGIYASLTAGGGSGFAKGDTYVGIENLTGTAFADTLVGDNNANTLRGGAGIDKLSGSGGNDTLIGGAGADQLSGGAGTSDTVSYEGSSDGVTVSLATNTASGGDATGDTITGFENITGSGFADTLTGDALANILTGGGGDDLLTGGGGRDTLLGGEGADKLYGGLAADTLTGGAGADTFFFTNAEKVTDVITDYTRGEDKIDLRGIDAVASTTAVEAFRYIGTGAFTAGKGGQLRFYIDGANGYLAGDVNGDKVADFTILLEGANRILVGDLVLA